MSETTRDESHDPPRCMQCGYRLEQLREPRCPECGHSFKYADPRLYRLRSYRGRSVFLLALTAVVSDAVLFSTHWSWTPTGVWLLRLKNTIFVICNGWSAVSMLLVLLFASQGLMQQRGLVRDRWAYYAAFGVIAVLFIFRVVASLI